MHFIMSCRENETWPSVSVSTVASVISKTGAGIQVLSVFLPPAPVCSWNVCKFCEEKAYYVCLLF